MATKCMEALMQLYHQQHTHLSRYCLHRSENNFHFVKTSFGHINQKCLPTALTKAMC